MCVCDRNTKIGTYTISAKKTFLSRERERERERENFIEINRKHDDTCTNKNYNEGVCGLIQGDLR